MNMKMGVAALLCTGASLFLSGCQHPDTVLFVTDTSLGINFDNKPPTTSIAYDRTEGYFAPRYKNGTLPPAVASIDVGGGFFDPAVRQVYATGDAARYSTDRAFWTDESKKKPNGTTSDTRQVFFGTSTTIGAKIGWGPDGVAGVDSFHFGYDRKEFSYLPLRPLPPNNQPYPSQDVSADVYPSVLASIDSSLDSSQSGGLVTQQFFSTGVAADALAQTDDVRRSFGTAAAIAAATALPAAQAPQVKAALVGVSANLISIDACVAPAGQFSQMILAALVAAAQQATPGWMPGDLAMTGTLMRLHDKLGTDSDSRKALAAASTNCPKG